MCFYVFSPNPIHSTLPSRSKTLIYFSFKEKEHWSICFGEEKIPRNCIDFYKIKHYSLSQLGGQLPLTITILLHLEMLLYFFNKIIVK